MIDNFKKLEENLFRFRDGSYYKFEAIIRQKDGENILATNNNSSSIKYWVIENEESYKKLKPVMIEFINLTGARLYVTLDRKSTIKTLVNFYREISNLMTDTIYGHQYSIQKLNKIFASVSSKKDSTDKKDEVDSCRTWLIYMDSKNELLLEQIEDFTKKSDNHICTLETRNGYHIICKKQFAFRAWLDAFETYVTIHKRNTMPISIMNKLIKEAYQVLELKENALGLVYSK